MFLIDKPFVSDFLIHTLKTNNYKLVATKEAKELISDESLNWISEEIAIHEIEKEPNATIYINSENAIAWISKNISTPKILDQIQFFKDKFKFRDLVKDLFPNFYYMTVKIEDIQNLKLDDIKFPFVIKPSLGFFSLGVHIIHNKKDWIQAKKELNYDTLRSSYPKEVLDVSNFIIEEFIKGEEFAVDCYFNNLGEVVILNVLHHKFSSGSDVSDRVYSTSKEIFFKYYEEIEGFLNILANKTGLKNFPAHVEIRINTDGEICPIEINPLRFGGWCTTGDLSWYAFGINSYEFFISNKKPNWKKIFKDKDNKIYSIIVLNNSSDFHSSEISCFNYNLLEKDFENVLNLRKLDIKKYPVFGFLFTETSSENENELNKILISNLNKYIETK